MNYLLDTDSYKVSHHVQYPHGTTCMFSYVESRGGLYPETVFFGLQYYINQYLTYRVTVEDVEKAKKFYKKHGVPFNYDGWMYIAQDLGGRLPVKIRAVPEGTVVPTHNALMTIESTDPKVFWIVSWLETMLLRVWYPITVATRSRHIKGIIMKALEKSSDDPEAEINFKLHDFGSRGVSSRESAMLGGAAHLVNFKGSDTIAGVLCANQYYNCDMAGYSIPAAEHSTITSWGREGEVDAYRNMLKNFAKPGSLVAVVSDSYDLWNACSNLWGDVLKQEVIDSGATVIIRPDSGDPPTVVLKSVQLLEEKFGSIVNTKGYKVLNNVRVIQGDGINENSIDEILRVLLDNGYSATNIAFGMGGGLLQQLDRDSLKFAMKCSHIFVGERSVDVYKQPVTDSGKDSKKGRLDLIKTDEVWQTIYLYPRADKHQDSEMITVYKNGVSYASESLDNIRGRASI